MSYNEFLVLVEYNLPLILGVIVFLLLIMIIVSIVLSVSNRKLKKRYEILMRDADKSSLEEMIKSYQTKIDHTFVDSKVALEKIGVIDKRLAQCVQKVGVVRFQAFEDVGSDLSYSVALLDENNSGVIITSIFGRNMSTSYAKPITEGLSNYEFSNEEIYAMNMALGLEGKENIRKTKKAH